MAFPAGPRHGSYLHSLLERVDYGIGVRTEAQRAELARDLQRNGYKAEWHSAVIAMIDDVRGCTLDGADLRLESIATRDRVTEMRFTLPLAEQETAGA